MLITLRRIVVFALVGVVVCMLEVVLQIDFAASSVEVERKQDGVEVGPVVDWFEIVLQTVVFALVEVVVCTFEIVLQIDFVMLTAEVERKQDRVEVGPVVDKFEIVFQTGIETELAFFAAFGEEGYPGRTGVVFGRVVIRIVGFVFAEFVDKFEIVLQTVDFVM